MDAPGRQQQATVTDGRNGRAQASEAPAGTPGAPAPATSPVDEKPAKKRRGPPLVVLVILAVLVIAGLFWGVHYLGYASTHQSTDDAQVQADTVVISSKIAERVAAVLVDTNQPVRRGQVVLRLENTDERTRLVQAQASLSAQRANVQAAQQNVDLVRAQQSAQNAQNSGGIASAQSGITNAALQTQSARTQIAVARAAVRTAQAQLDVANAAVPGAREALRRAQNDYDRTAALVRTGDLAQSQLDAQRSTLASARSTYQQALDNVSGAQSAVAADLDRVTSAIASANATASQIGGQQGQLATAQGKLSESSTPYRVTAQEAQAAAAGAQLGSLQAQIRTAQDQLSYTVIRSPIDGFVGEKNIAIGATVAPGQALLNIVPKTGVYITANYKETQIGKMSIGDDVDVHIDAYPGKDFHGKVTALGPASQNEFSLVPAQNATGNFVKVTQRIPVRIIVDNAPANMPLRPGMSAETAVALRK